MVIGRRSLLLAGAALPVASRTAKSQCVTDTPAVDACRGGVRITQPPGATLDLSFMNPGTLDPRIIFTRASTATYFNSAGVMQTAATNAPRWDYDPVTHALRGLLIEEARTNVILQSGDISNAAWTKGGSPPVVTGNNTTAPDGTLTASSVAFLAVPSAPNFSTVSQSFTATAAAYAVSVFLKGAVGGERVYISVTPDGVLYYRTQLIATTAWQRVVLVTPNLTAATWYYGIGTDLRDAGQTTTPAQTVYVWGAQLEAGAFPTSYIPVTTAAVTRAIDSCTIPPANMGFFVSPGGSWSAEFIDENPAPPAGFQRIVSIITPSSIAPLLLSPTNQAGQYDGAASVVTVNTMSASTVAKAASTWAAGSSGICLNGGAVASSAALSSGYPQLATTGVQLMVNATVGDAMSGYIRRVRYWPRALTAAELQSVTT